MKKIILILSFVTNLGFGLYAQKADSLPGLTLPFPNALENKNEVTHLLLNVDNDNFVGNIELLDQFKHVISIKVTGKLDDKTANLLFANLGDVEKLRHLSLENNQLKKTPKSITGLKSLKTLEIKNNEQLNYNALFRQLAEIPGLAGLSLSQNGLSKVPAGIIKLQGLERLSIESNPNLDIPKLFEYLSQLSNLKELSLPINDITELPGNVEVLQSLQVLDVSSNNISELPEGMAQVKKLSGLNIQGNLIIDHLAQIEKLKGLPIKHLVVDNDVSNDEIAKIKGWFPGITIDFKPEDLVLDAVPVESESGSQVSGIGKEYPKSGSLLVSDKVKVYSSAYLLYPVIFNGIRYEFDSTSFEERYRDTTYANVYKIQPNRSFSYVQFWKQWKRKGAKDEVWFHLPTSNYVSRNHPELRAFTGMYWIYEGDLSARKFRRKYISRRNLLFQNKIYWTDLRIYFNDDDLNFTIELKNEHGFTEFRAYPRASRNIPIENAQKQYHRRNERYQRYLLKRKDKFYRQLSKNRQRYNRSHQLQIDKAWAELSLYMSDREKQMTREEWLEYFDQIVADEKEALENASANAGNLERSLLINEYQRSYLTESFTAADNGQTFIVNVDFEDKSKNKLPASNIYVINKTTKSFYRIAGSMGLNRDRIFLETYGEFVIVAELRNGDLISTPVDIRKIVGKNNYTFTAEVYNGKLQTLGQLNTSAGLQ